MSISIWSTNKCTSDILEGRLKHALVTLAMLTKKCIQRVQIEGDEALHVSELHRFQRGFKITKADKGSEKN